MSVKASISLTDAQESFARDLVAQGRYASLSAVLQQGLDLLRQQTEAQDAELAGLRLLIAERKAGQFLSAAVAEEQTARMLARKRAEHGLAG